MSLDSPSRQTAEQNIADYLAPCIGKCVTGVSGGATQHSLDGIYGPSDVVLDFEDGSSLTLSAYWCNDGTADLAIGLRPAPTEETP